MNAETFTEGLHSRLKSIPVDRIQQLLLRLFVATTTISDICITMYIGNVLKSATNSDSQRRTPKKGACRRSG
jgi:hypothetical protein